jgi:hypothetical protein
MKPARSTRSVGTGEGQAGDSVGCGWESREITATSDLETLEPWPGIA